MEKKIEKREAHPYFIWACVSFTLKVPYMVERQVVYKTGFSILSMYFLLLHNINAHWKNTEACHVWCRVAVERLPGILTDKATTTMFVLSRGKENFMAKRERRSSIVHSSSFKTPVYKA